MSAAVGRMFLDFSARKLAQLNSRVADCLSRLDEDAIWKRGGETGNAIGNLVLHLTGNVRQWILSGVGGSHDTRHRDREFAAQGGVSKADLLARLDGAMSEATGILESLAPERLADPIKPQGYEVTVLKAIYHVVEHFSQHTGQIIFATKLATGQDLGYYGHLSQPAHSEQTP